MKFFDLHLHSAFSEGESSLGQLASMAKELGYTGLCFSEYFNNDNQLKKLRTEIAKTERKVGIKIFLGFEARNEKELAKLVARRKRFDVLLVQGGNLKLNRQACQTSQVDVLTHPESNRNDSGLNHVLVKEAARNGVAIEINFRQILLANKRSRSQVLKNMVNNVKLARHFKAPIIICSGAISHYELRDPQVLVSFATQLGLPLAEAKNSLSAVPEEILQQSQERKDDRWIMPGVKVIK